ncbi:MAG: hypothetical protein F6K00_17430 [Leptolyngbya sp. SIOISBB]|nr:hypothetical protein [Leptolyngbya sp. SIOISBB]
MEYRYIVSHNHGGLCNRLKSLVSAQRFAAKYHLEPQLYWPVGGACGGHFRDLFTNQITELSPEEFGVIFSEVEQSSLYKFLSTWSLLVFPEDNIPEGFSRQSSSGTGRDINYEYNRIPTSVRKSILPYFQTLQPVESIQDEVQEFSQRFSDTTISAHIRSWVSDDPIGQSRAKLFDIKCVYKAFDRFPDRDFYVASDSPQVIESLRERYGQRIYYYDAEEFTGRRNSAAGMQKALVELYLLARNPVLIATWNSTFSETAWWLGGAHAQVELIPLKRPWRNAEYRQVKRSNLRLDLKQRSLLLYTMARFMKQKFS